MNNLIIAVVAWWIAEGSGLMQKAIWWLIMKGYRKSNRFKPFDCPLCLAFWIGLGFTWNPIDAIICSAIAIGLSKIYIRL